VIAIEARPIRALSRALVLVLFPIVLGVVTFSFGLVVEPQLLLPAATLLTATLMGLVTVMFTRVKDAAGIARPEVGTDPARRSYLAFRSASVAALTALLLAAGCLILLYVGPTWEFAARLGSAVILGATAHLGGRLVGVIYSLRTEVEEIMGDRVVAPSTPGRAELIVKRTA
jgi:membrane associated rhomboid family serine protease